MMIFPEFAVRSYCYLCMYISIFLHDLTHDMENIISAMLKVPDMPDGTFSWKWLKSLAQRSDLNLVGSTWSPK